MGIIPHFDQNLLNQFSEAFSFMTWFWITSEMKSSKLLRKKQTRVTFSNFIWDAREEVENVGPNLSG